VGPRRLGTVGQMAFRNGDALRLAVELREARGGGVWWGLRLPTEGRELKPGSPLGGPALRNRRYEEGRGP